MTNREAFEEWFTDNIDTLISVKFDKANQVYDYAEVELAWSAWNAGIAHNRLFG